MGLLDDIEISESSESSYMKFEKGENRFRMVSKPTLGYIYWEDKTPTRIAKASEAADGSEPKLFWSMIVWNNDRVRILEITQSTVHKALKSLEDNSDWGNLTEYDVIVNKNGEEAIATIKDFNKNYDPKKIFEGVEQSDADSLPF